MSRTAVINGLCCICVQFMMVKIVKSYENPRIFDNFLIVLDFFVMMCYDYYIGMMPGGDCGTA